MKFSEVKLTISLHAMSAYVLSNDKTLTLKSIKF